MAERKFDVFLCHNSEDKLAVIEIAEQLRCRGLKPWLDVWELQPGAIWQFALEQQIESIGAVAVFAGQKGMGPWQSEEVYAFLQEFIRRQCPVIPVMLPDTLTQPRLPIFLKNRHWVDFRLQEPEPYSQLIWGITGERPSEESLNVAETVSVEEAEQFSDIVSSVLDTKYADLERYLKSGQWKEADNETSRLMVTEMGKDERQRFEPEDLLNFPCEPLRVIDGLWVKYSNGKFGFSVQKKMYVECGGILDGKCYKGAWYRLCKINGWHAREGIKYDLQSPAGHLPANLPGYRTRSYSKAGSYVVVLPGDPRFDYDYRQDEGESDCDGSLSYLSSLASRLVNCNL